MNGEGNKKGRKKRSKALQFHKGKNNRTKAIEGGNSYACKPNLAAQTERKFSNCKMNCTSE